MSKTVQVKVQLDLSFDMVVDQTLTEEQLEEKAEINCRDFIDYATTYPEWKIKNLKLDLTEDYK